jgi:hypothetical protein
VSVSSNKTLELVGSPTGSSALVVSNGIVLAPGAVLAGVGNFQGNVSFANGAKLSPGSTSASNPLGLLSVDSGTTASQMTWGTDGRYRWEINDVAGAPGAVFGNGWDSLKTAGVLNITSTSARPFVIEVVGLDENGVSGSIAGMKPGEYRWLIAQANTIVGFAASKFAFDTSQAALSSNQFSALSILRDGNSLYLQATVIPEPSSILFVSILVIVLLPRIRPT